MIHLCMAFTLENVVPWGRSYNEYVAMFALSGEDLRKRILGCGDGPAAFNSGLTRDGGTIVSADPLYRYSRGLIKKRIDETCQAVLEQTRQNQDEFIWKTITSVEELGRIRMAAMETFLDDYDAGRKEGRYIDAELPVLPFDDGTFDLALCSHFLFLYSAQLSVDFHIVSIKELCRVAGEARVFPLLELGSICSRHVDPVCEALTEAGYQVSVQTVPYEFQKGGNRMLRVTKPVDT